MYSIFSLCRQFTTINRKKPARTCCFSARFTAENLAVRSRLKSWRTKFPPARYGFKRALLLAFPFVIPKLFRRGNATAKRISIGFLNVTSTPSRMRQNWPTLLSVWLTDAMCLWTYTHTALPAPLLFFWTMGQRLVDTWLSLSVYRRLLKVGQRCTGGLRKLIQNKRHTIPRATRTSMEKFHLPLSAANITPCRPSGWRTERS